MVSWFPDSLRYLTSPDINPFFPARSVDFCQIDTYINHMVRW